MAKRLLCLLLCLLLLAGCSPAPELQTFTCGDVTVSLPSAFQKIEKEGYDFFYSSGSIAVLGMEEEKSDLGEYMQELSAAAYAELLRQQVGAGEAPAEQDGSYRFTYTAGEMTYITAVYETEDSFWALQAYCTTEHFENYRDTMNSYLSDAIISKK